MPLFGRKSDEERHQEAAQDRQRGAAQRDQLLSQEALAAGGLPLQATRRLQDLAAHPGIFTSDLSVDEFLLVKQAGFEPVTQVMGSSIYHVGFQTRGWSGWSGYGTQELQVVTRAMNHARELALGRLQQEATLAGADAVVGVRMTRGQYEWSTDLIEFQAIGTAVRQHGRPKDGSPVLTNLSGQDFWKLVNAGYAPRGIVAASSVFYVVANWQTQGGGNWYGWGNQEMQNFTAGMYQARAGAMDRVHRQAAASGAGGIVGVVIDRAAREVEVGMGNDVTRRDMIITFHVIGTAVTGRPNVIPRPQAVVSLDKS